MKRIVKQTRNNGELVLEEINRRSAKDMITKNHYSKNWNTSFGRINIGIFRDQKLLGCACFGNLMNPKSWKQICTSGFDSIVELNRLWVDDVLGRNAESVLIGASFKLIKNNHKNIKHIQSFTDGRLGVETIYKAANFKYFGYTKSLFFEDVEDGKVFHKIPLENTNRPVGFLNKNRRYLDGKLKAFHVKTYRYIYSLYKRDKSLLLKPIKYPKYEKGVEITDFKQPLGLLVRLYLMYSYIGDNRYREKALQKIIELDIGQTKLDKELDKQRRNKYVIQFQESYIKSQANMYKVLKPLW